MANSYADAYNLWIQAGGPQWAAPVAAAIAGAESSFGANPYGDRTNTSDPSTATSFGLWQIHTPAHPQYDPAQLVSDPLYNAKAAVQIFNAAGQQFTPWSTFNNGTYLSYLADGQANAASGVGSGPLFSNPSAPSTTSSSASVTQQPSFTPSALSSSTTTYIIVFVAIVLLIGGYGLTRGGAKA